MILLLWLWQWLVSECILCSSSPKLFWFPSFSQAFFLSSLNLMLDHLWKSEFSELTGSPWVMGTFFPFSPIPILPRRKHIQCAEWEVPSCWTPRTPGNFPHFPQPFWIKCLFLWILTPCYFSPVYHFSHYFHAVCEAVFYMTSTGKTNQKWFLTPLLYLSHHTSYILSLILNYRMHI